MGGVLFEKLLHMSLIGSYSILIVLFARCFLKKVGRKYAYYLWLIVFVNLCIPFSIKSPVSLIPVWIADFSSVEQKQTVEEGSLEEVHVTDAQMVVLPEEDTAREGQTEHAVQPGTEHAVWPAAGQDVQTGVSQEGQTETQSNEEWKKAVDVFRNMLLLWGERIWLVGVCVFMLYSAVTALRLNRRIRDSFGVCLNKKERIVELEGIGSPFLWGILHPTIYVPTDMAEKERTYIIAHEACHRRRMDHLVKMAIYGMTVLHWFNPFVWMAYSFCCKDMEMSCDEIVLERSEKSIRKAYAESLLKYAAKQSGYVMMPLTFGEPSVRSRIEHVLRYRRKGIVLSGLAIILSIMVAAGLLLRPDEDRAADADTKAVVPGDVETDRDTVVTSGSEQGQEIASLTDQEEELAYLTDPVPGRPCGDPAMNGWNLDQWKDLRSQFSTWSYVPDPDMEDLTYLLENTEHYKLYGSGDYERMLLEYEGQYAEIFYPYTSNYMIPVDMVEYDYDSDGTPELSMKLQIKHGTGIYIDSFFMADMASDGLYVYQFLEEDIIAQLNKHLAYERKEQGMQALVDGSIAGPLLNDVPGQRPYERVSIGNQIWFYLRDTNVQVSALLEFYTDDETDFVFDSNDYDIRANVSYQDGGRIVLTEYESRNTEVEWLAKAAAEDYFEGDFRIIDVRYDVHDTGGRATAVVLPEGADSYDYLELELDGTWGNWTVKNMYLEK